MSEETNFKLIGNALHQRLVNGDVTASAEIAEMFLPSMVTHLKVNYPELKDLHLIDTAAEDAIINYLNRPRQYNPDKANLLTYLCISARGDLLNLLQKAKKHSDHLQLAEDVEFDEVDSEYKVVIRDGTDLEEQVFARLSPVWGWLKEFLPDPVDRQMVELIMDGVRETSAYADTLGVSHLDADEQVSIVKRHKDRLKKMLQRHINRSELYENG